MRTPGLILLATVLASPVLAYLVFRAAKGLGFLDSPVSREQELRRTILAAVYALLIFLPVFLFGWERRWPRVWIVFGVVSGLALLFFAASGIVSARELWRLRHGQGSGVGGPEPGGEQGEVGAAEASIPDP